MYVRGSWREHHWTSWDLDDLVDMNLISSSWPDLFQSGFRPTKTMTLAVDYGTSWDMLEFHGLPCRSCILVVHLRLQTEKWSVQCHFFWDLSIRGRSPATEATEPGGAAFKTAQSSDTACATLGCTMKDAAMKRSLGAHRRSDRAILTGRTRS